MADDLNKKMDAMLRAYAKKRGETPVEQMHPATRRMLQDEVRRVHGGSVSARGRWRVYLPRFAFAAAICLVIGLTAAVLKTSPREQRLAAVQGAESLRTADAPSVPKLVQQRTEVGE